MRHIDESRFLIRLLQRISEWLAKQRGLPIIIGIVFVLLSLLVQVANLYANSPVLELAGVIFLHVGILIALIGILLIEPIGK